MIEKIPAIPDVLSMCIYFMYNSSLKQEHKLKMTLTSFVRILYAQCNVLYIFELYISTY